MKDNRTYFDRYYLANTVMLEEATEDNCNSTCQRYHFCAGYYQVSTDLIYQFMNLSNCQAQGQGQRQCQTSKLDPEVGSLSLKLLIVKLRVRVKVKVKSQKSKLDP